MLGHSYLKQVGFAYFSNIMNREGKCIGKGLSPYGCSLLLMAICFTTKRESGSKKGQDFNRQMTWDLWAQTPSHI